MNKLLPIVAAALCAVGALAQDGPKPGHGPGDRPACPPKQGFSPNACIWVTKVLAKPAVLEKVGVTDKATQELIAGKMAVLDKQGAELEQKIRKLSREQAELMKAVLADKDADQKPLMDKIDEIAALRAEQGRLAVSALIILRDNMSKEEIDKAMKFVCERGMERGFMRGPAPFDGRRGPEFGKRRKPGGDGGENGRPEFKKRDHKGPKDPGRKGDRHRKGNRGGDQPAPEGPEATPPPQGE